MISAMAMFLVLSAFNGLDQVIKSLYSSFDPDIKITSRYGKIIDLKKVNPSDLFQIKGVQEVSVAVEEIAYISNDGTDMVCRLKGVDSSFKSVVAIEESLYDGQYAVEDTNANFALVGYGVARNLQLFLTEYPDPLQVYTAKRKGPISLMSPEQSFKKALLYPKGIFAINQDFDAQYIVTSISFMRKLMQYSVDEVSSIELKVLPESNTAQLVEELSMVYGDSVDIRSRAQLNAVVYQTNKTEKWITYCILLFVVIVSIMNLIGSVTMMVLDKQKDIYTMKTMGFTFLQVKSIFVKSGVFIAFFGAVLGLFFGVVLVWVQQNIGLVRLNNSIVEFYPVNTSIFDIFVVFITILGIGFLCAYSAVYIVLKKNVFYLR